MDRREGMGFVSIREAAQMLGVSPSTLRRLENNQMVLGYGVSVHYTPGGQRRYRRDEVEGYAMHRGFGRKIEFGRQPAVVVIDLTAGMLDRESPMSLKQDAVRARVLAGTCEILATARKLGVPVAFSVTQYSQTSPASQLWAKKMPALSTLQPGSEWVALDPLLARQDCEPIFFTHLVSHFRTSGLLEFVLERGVDTVIFCGVSTSGSVRTSAVDALQLGLRPVVVADAVGDRNEGAHVSSLSDLEMKYADVVGAREVVRFLRSIH